jgi:inosine-uridine nucleoside N-ribohydrolase
VSPAGAPRPLLIDCDPGRDDAVALLLACASPEALDLQAVTTVAGNVPLALTTRNARRVLEFAGRPEVPVHAGCPRPLVRPLVTATHVHGDDGLGGASLPGPARPAGAEHAVAAIIRRVREAPEPLTIAALGPLTNLGCALVMAPDIATRVRDIVVMGGALAGGNVTAGAEFNLFVDPHAAAVVLGCGAPLTLVPLDLTRRVVPDDALLAAFTRGTRAQRLLATMWAGPRDAVHDACVIARLLGGVPMTGSRRRMRVMTDESPGIGRSFEDPAGGEALVLDGIDAHAFFGLLRDRLT